MLFYLHYSLMTSGLCGVSVLLAVFLKAYTDASQSEIGILLMSYPFVGLIIKPLFCSMADRKQAHRRFLLISIVVEMIGYAPFAIIPFFPSFYENHPRASWYVMIVACQLGNGGLGVAWSLGDCLAMNMSQKTGVPFGRMRLMGTVSWGVFGFVIGQINEVWFLPKYVPAFLILHASLIAELLLICLWNSDAFEMVDPASVNGGAKQLTTGKRAGIVDSAVVEPAESGTSSSKLAELALADSVPSSSGGTLRLKASTAKVIGEFFATASAEEDLARKLKVVQDEQAPRDFELAAGERVKSSSIAQSDSKTSEARKNPQLILLKMLMKNDGRIIKYACTFTLFGFVFAPMNFVFLDMEAVCYERGYNFSQLAGAVLISQASIETAAFYLVPKIMRYTSRSLLILLGLMLMLVRYYFYANYYHLAQFSPYWAVVAEWCHGITYAIVCIMQAELALKFASQARVFVGELRKLGYLSDERSTSRDQVESEERSVNLALRATMQALFNGLMDGAGQGFGALTCGLYIESYSFVSLWQMLWITVLVSMVAHQLIELTRSPWSDTYKPAEGTKAYEIMGLTKETPTGPRDSATIDKPAAIC